MSIVFKPKIAFSFGSGRVEAVRPKAPKVLKHWSNLELGKLADLCALGLSYSDCSNLLKRSKSSCQSAVDDRSLYIRIMKKREKMIDEIVNPKEQDNE